MNKLPVTIGAVTSFAAFYQIAPFVGVANGVIYVLAALYPIFVLYMAYVILKYGIPCQNTFDDKFYEDSDYRRNRPKAPLTVGAGDSEVRIEVHRS